MGVVVVVVGISGVITYLSLRGQSTMASWQRESVYQPRCTHKRIICMKKIRIFVYTYIIDARPGIALPLALSLLYEWLRLMAFIAATSALGNCALSEDSFSVI